MSDVADMWARDDQVLLAFSNTTPTLLLPLLLLCSVRATLADVRRPSRKPVATEQLVRLHLFLQVTEWQPDNILSSVTCTMLFLIRSWGWLTSNGQVFGDVGDLAVLDELDPFATLSIHCEDLALLPPPPDAAGCSGSLDDVCTTATVRLSPCH